jgi:prophage antirepressor-like protein
MTQTKAISTIFEYQFSQVRVIMRGDDPWFVAKDVATVLGVANSRDAIARLKESEKDDVGISDAIGRTQRTTIISEYALYKLAFRSNKPEAEAFTDWVASEVLPAIRKTGEYSTKQHPSKHTLTDTFRLRALVHLRRVPDGYFSVMSELFKHLYNLEALFHRSLDEHAMIEISVGLRWARYAREVLNIPDQHRCKYAHSMCQGGRIEQVWAYALHYVTTFDKWLWEVYFPQHFPDYERYRARYIGLPAPKTRKHLPSLMNRAQAVQARFEWE